LLRPNTPGGELEFRRLALLPAWRNSFKHLQAKLTSSRVKKPYRCSLPGIPLDQPRVPKCASGFSHGAYYSVFWSVASLELQEGDAKITLRGLPRSCPCGLPIERLLEMSGKKFSKGAEQKTRFV
jgi:hypothetical protein